MASERVRRRSPLEVDNVGDIDAQRPPLCAMHTRHRQAAAPGPRVCLAAALHGRVDSVYSWRAHARARESACPGHTSQLLGAPRQVDQPEEYTAVGCPILLIRGVVASDCQYSARCRWHHEQPTAVFLLRAPRCIQSISTPALSAMCIRVLQSNVTTSLRSRGDMNWPVWLARCSPRPTCARQMRSSRPRR